jgi:hypothetical protein
MNVCIYNSLECSSETASRENTGQLSVYQIPFISDIKRYIRGLLPPCMTVPLPSTFCYIIFPLYRMTIEPRSGIESIAEPDGRGRVQELRLRTMRSGMGRLTTCAPCDILFSGCWITSRRDVPPSPMVVPLRGRFRCMAEARCVVRTRRSACAQPQHGLMVH